MQCTVLCTSDLWVCVVVDLVPMECRTMLEDFSLRLLVSTAYAQWDYG